MWNDWFHINIKSQQQMVVLRISEFHLVKWKWTHLFRMQLLKAYYTPCLFLSPSWVGIAARRDWGVLQWFFVSRQSQSEMDSDFSLYCSILRRANVLILCLYIFIFTLCVLLELELEHHSNFQAAELPSSTWMVGCKIRPWQGMKNQSLLPLICFNVSLGQNIIPQSIPSLSAHFFFTSSALQRGSGETFWDFSICGTGVKQCLNACLSGWNIQQFSIQEAVPVSLGAFKTSEVWSFGQGQIVCSFVFLHSLLKNLSVCVRFSGLKGEFCRFHFISESALPWWGLCKMLLFLLQEFREAVCEGRMVFGTSVALGAQRKKKKKETFLFWWLLFHDFPDVPGFQRSTMIY